MNLFISKWLASISLVLVLADAEIVGEIVVAPVIVVAAAVRRANIANIFVFEYM